MRVCVYLFMNGFWLWGQSPFFTLDINAYLGAQFPAALGFYQQAYGSVGSEYSRWNETNTQIQNVNFAFPTQGDRWTWGLQLLMEQGFAQKSQQLALGWAFRLPLNKGKQIFLGTRLMGRNHQYVFDDLQHIERPDPLLFNDQSFTLDYSTSLAFQSKQSYFIIAVNDLPFSDSSKPFFSPPQKQFYALMGYHTKRDVTGQWHTLAGIRKNKVATEYFGLLKYIFSWESQIILYASSQRVWSLRWQQNLQKRWTVGFAYGQITIPLRNPSLGFSLAYHWRSTFTQDKPVESLDYKGANPLAMFQNSNALLSYQ